VVLFTFPWDNWAVKRGVWDFPDDRIWFRVAALPIEEVSFFVIQTLQVGLVTSALIALYPTNSRQDVTFNNTALLLIGASMISWLMLGFASRAFRRSNPRFTYAWHLLYWFVPIIVIQWMFGWPVLLPRWYAIVFPAVVIGTLLTVADVWAVKRGIWFFDFSLVSSSRRLWNVLPWEEAAFFYCTSILVAQSTLLFLPLHAR